MSQISSQTPESQATTPELFKLLELETTQVIESFRWLAAQLLNVATVFLLANLTVLGYASANRQAGLFMIAILITIILLMAYMAGIIAAVPLICRLIALEDTASAILGRKQETGISLIFLNVMSTKFLGEIQRVNAISDQIEKQAAMKRLTRKMWFGFSTGKGTLALIIAILAQAALVPILIYVFHWKLF